MAQSYGAAQPIVDYLKRGVETAERFLDKIPSGSSNKDDGYIAKRTREATASFAKRRGTSMKGSSSSTAKGRTSGKRKTRKPNSGK